MICRWLSQGGRLEQIVLATEVYEPIRRGANDHRVSPYHIRTLARAACDGCKPITSTSTTASGRPADAFGDILHPM